MKYIFDKLYSDEYMKDKEGHWFSEKDIKTLINHDADIYVKQEGSNNPKLIAVFRKNYIKDDLNKLAFKSFAKAAMPSRGRGAAAGIINSDSVYWKKRIPVNTNKWNTGYIVNGNVSKMKVNNQVASNVVGFYEGTAFLKLPPRMTNYTRTHLEKVTEGLPYLQRLNSYYKKYAPNVYKVQKAGFNKGFSVPETEFSSITINRNFRTGLHRDAGNFKKGFAVMSVLERGKYKGGYTMFPQYGVAFDIRQGDCIVFDNTNTWHCNSKFVESKSDKMFNGKLEDIFRDNKEVGTAGLEHKFSRISFVAYLREKLSELKKIDKKTEYYVDWNSYAKKYKKGNKSKKKSKRKSKKRSKKRSKKK